MSTLSERELPESLPRTAFINQRFSSNLEHLLTELQRTDLLIQLQVRRARRLSAADEQFQGLYISDAEVDDFLARPAGLPRWATAEDNPEDAGAFAALAEFRTEIEAASEVSARNGIHLRLPELSRMFGLEQEDVDILLICLAPEFDMRYERIYGYLQDDITKRRPGVDLVLNLISRSLAEKLALRARFGPDRPLIASQILHICKDAAEPHATLLGHYLRVDPRIVSYLLGSDDHDVRLAGIIEQREGLMSIDDHVMPAAQCERLRRLARHSADSPAFFYVQGPGGSGRRTLGQIVAGMSGRSLLVIDTERMVADSSPEALVRCAIREALLLNAAPFFNNFDILLTDDRESLRRTVLLELDKRAALAFGAAPGAWEAGVELPHMRFVRVELPLPTLDDRMELWRRALAESTTDGVDIEAVANSFRFRPRQIQEASISAGNLAWRRQPEGPVVTIADLYQAARLHSNVRLAALARKLTPRYTWQDIILPEDRLQQLREMCCFVNFRSTVYDKWGFDQKLSLGKGLNVLFAGPPGTGKTMAAEVIANDLGLDVYKIDLSMVVSKYIGETEKNLSRIFTEAETSNAILFFDEADALFGKRSEVRDSHDRYANIEIGYLLQRMEEYEGVVILASNFRKNMDEAFVRRLHFAVEFPMPDEHDRRRIWEGVWPQRTPRHDDVDLPFLAHRFEIAGGNIRNIALGSAFLAAQDGGEVRMKHVVRATRREYQKMGKVVMAGEFGIELPDPEEELDG